MNSYAPFGRGVHVTSIPEGTLGMVKWFPDVDVSVQGTKTKNTNDMVKCRLVQNDSGGTLAASKFVDYKAGNIGTEVDSLSGTTSLTAGLVDEYISSAVPNLSYFWIVTEGMATVTTNATTTAGAILATAASGDCADAVAPPTDNDVARGLAAILSTTGRAYIKLPHGPS